jgi:hypothetical protein
MWYFLLIKRLVLGHDIAARKYHAPLSQATVAFTAVVVGGFSTTCAIDATGERDSLVGLSLPALAHEQIRVEISPQNDQKRALGRDELRSSGW